MYAKFGCCTMLPNRAQIGPQIRISDKGRHVRVTEASWCHFVIFFFSFLPTLRLVKSTLKLVKSTLKMEKSTLMSIKSTLKLVKSTLKLV